MTDTKSYMDGTHLFLGVEAILTPEEKDTFLANVVAKYPGMQGAHVADVVDMMSNYDEHLEVTEPLYEEHEDEIKAYGIPGLFSLCCYLAIYLHPENAEDMEKVWGYVKGYVARWDANRCGHAWYEAPQEGETPDHDAHITRTCTLDKGHTFPIDHHDRRAPNV